MDSNLVVLLVMIVLMVGGALLLNFQIKHSEKKEREQKQVRTAETVSTKPAMSHQ